MNNQLTIKDELTEFLLYTDPNGKVKVEVILHNESVWLAHLVSEIRKVFCRCE